jgi:hypothetical protein
LCAAAVSLALSRAAGPENLEHLLMGDEEAVGDDAPMAAPPERLGAGDDAALLRSPKLAAFFKAARKPAPSA